ncbi:DUF6138 family protein [Paenibacillus sp. NPDC058071]|uniref:DUF6138 family protein n=1 Tax=Paenibacillus sp. NPDC058071 TaxID=3346326 RepID=UPI0036D9B22F
MVNLRDYHVKADTQEKKKLFDQCIEEVKNGTCSTSSEYPEPLRLTSGETILTSSLIEYFLDKLEQEGFTYEKAAGFCEKIRKITTKDISYTLDLWIKRTIQEPYFDSYKKNGYDHYKVKSDIDYTSVNQEYIRFVCYIAIWHIKYGMSFEFVTANRFFQFVTDLGSDEVARLKKYGTGNLPLEMTDYKDSSITLKANDVFATIKISVAEENEASYRTILNLINNLLQSDFPKSYSIEFKSKEKNYIPIKGLPKKGVNQLFANAVKYPSLHPLIEQYAKLAMCKYEQYNNMSDENCAMPSTFAIFALGLEGEQYFELVQQYMELCDEEHSSVQSKFTPAFIEKYGCTKTTFPVFISCILAVQEHKSSKIYASSVANEQGLNLLLDCKANIPNYVSESMKEDWSGDSEEEMRTYLWQSIGYTIWGVDIYKEANKVIKSAPRELKSMYEQLLS